LIYVDARLFKFSKTNLDAAAAILPLQSDPGHQLVELAPFFGKFNPEVAISLFGELLLAPRLRLGPWQSVG